METPPQCLRQAVQTETANLKVLWSARPDPWAYARRRWKDLLIGIPFTMFAVLLTWGTSGEFTTKSGKSYPSIFFLWGCMFIILGCWILSSPFLALWRARRVFYVVTERGALIFNCTWSLKIQSFDVSGFGGFERVSHGGRGGDVLFQRTIEGEGKNTRITEVGFLGLRDFSEAEQALRQMMEARSK